MKLHKIKTWCKILSLLLNCNNSKSKKSHVVGRDVPRSLFNISLNVGLLFGSTKRHLFAKSIKKQSNSIWERGEEGGEGRSDFFGDLLSTSGAHISGKDLSFVGSLNDI
jgi:hypothetical protein